jgi:hypothetical protein
MGQVPQSKPQYPIIESIAFNRVFYDLRFACAKVACDRLDQRAVVTMSYNLRGLPSLFTDWASGTPNSGNFYAAADVPGDEPRDRLPWFPMSRRNQRPRERNSFPQDRAARSQGSNV